MIFFKNLNNLDFIPYSRYNQVIEGISWYNINYDDQTGIGAYVLKFNPKSKTKEHVHLGDESFFVLDGTIYDSLTKQTYVKDNYVNLKKDSIHYSYSENGCTLLVFSQGHIKRF